MIRTPHFILYVHDQALAERFWSATLDLEPRLNVPGMTEYELGADALLGLMPERNIAALLPSLPHSPINAESPRAELYLLVDNPAAYHARALSAGATQLSPLLPRSWGHSAAYALDPDGHVIAFAMESPD